MVGQFWNLYFIVNSIILELFNTMLILTLQAWHIFVKMQVLNLLQGDTEMLKWAKQQVSNSLEDSKLLKDEELERSNLQSHLNLAFLDMEDDSLSMGSVEQGISVEDYLKGRESRSSSFNWACSVAKLLQAEMVKAFLFASVSVCYMKKKTSFHLDGWEVELWGFIFPPPSLGLGYN